MEVPAEEGTPAVLVTLVPLLNQEMDQKYASEMEATETSRETTYQRRLAESRAEWEEDRKRNEERRERETEGRNRRWEEDRRKKTKEREFIDEEMRRLERARWLANVVKMEEARAKVEEEMEDLKTRLAEAEEKRAAEKRINEVLEARWETVAKRREEEKEKERDEEGEKDEERDEWLQEKANMEEMMARFKAGMRSTLEEMQSKESERKEEREKWDEERWKLEMEKSELGKAKRKCMEENEERKLLLNEITRRLEGEKLVRERLLKEMDDMKLALDDERAKCEQLQRSSSSNARSRASSSSGASTPRRSSLETTARRTETNVDDDKIAMEDVEESRRIIATEVIRKLIDKVEILESLQLSPTQVHCH